MYEMDRTRPSPSTIMHSPADPYLTLELADCTLAIAVQRAAVASLWNPVAISQPLNVLPRSTVPLPTKVALMHLPHVDLDFATKLNDVSLLRLMLAWSTRPGGRPVNYSDPITLAMLAGHVRALDWWIDESGLCFKWNVAAIKAACINGRIDVLEWWAERGFPHLSDMEFVADVIFAATEGGHVHVLDWLWSHLPNAQDRFVEAVHDVSYQYYGTPIMKMAAKSGCIAVLEWWIAKAKSKLSKTPSLAPIVAAALYHGHEHVLEWCKLHPNVIKQQRIFPWNMVGASPLTTAVMNGLRGWIDELSLLVLPNEYWSASRMACQRDTQALEWLQQKGYLVGSRYQLTSIAASSLQPATKTIDTLEWIHKHVDATIPAHEETHETVWEPMFGACGVGKVHVLDWLVLHGNKIGQDGLAECFHAATRNCHVNVLDWLLMQSAISSDQLRGMASGIVSLVDCDLATWNWWLEHCGPLDKFAECFDSFIFYGQEDNRDCLAILQLWLDHVKSVCFGASSIKAAIASGHLEALEWFLHTAHVSQESFRAAFFARSCGSCPKLLLWFWANAAQLGLSLFNQDSEPIQWEPLEDPIPTHLARIMLKMPHAPIYEIETLSECDCVPMLQFLCDGNTMPCVHNVDLESVLIVASSNELYHVLDWWKMRSGLQIVQCPRAIMEGEVRITPGIKRWWLETGLCDTIVDYVSSEGQEEDW
ncbi:hypothetical protein BCR44DRAFT_35390 [Catenaria anguillulae PL171]|uniref:Ankyrin repeat-containing domain protein n=1 Tax=Catenaria anguillulae PL171 TaxID=765915 RepID=A0A1Y2HME5_9FUNG|nr:hypothetical protein BCR44DRAFT_35390 [Catenaria anguillulae PL171]